MVKYYLAIDIGASNGRHILGHMENGRMMLEEIYRFENGLNKINGELCWDLNKLFTEIKLGMKKCGELGKIPESVGIDTWAVDYVLLDKDNNILGNTVGYRDGRTAGMDEKVYSIIPEDKLYQKTGIQKLLINTIYQLMAVKEKHPEYMQKADSMLMIPDYFHFLLSGVKRTEYTNASTTQLLSPITKTWDDELINLLGFNRKMFQEIAMPGTVLGNLTPEIQNEVGYNCPVVLPATHDTGSAVLAVPSNNPDIYLSSGTWSLIGIERPSADCSPVSRAYNFTNEGGYQYRFRFLKNIMGLWMIQSVKKEFKENHSYSEICDMASKTEIKSIVDCNKSCFMAPESMIHEIQKYCRETKQQIPITYGEIAAVIYNSLAVCYRNAVEEIEKVTGNTYDTIHVVGGGSNAEYLNRLTAQFTKRKVTAGPSEATAIGNLMVQMMCKGELRDLSSARECVENSFDLKIYESK